MGILFAAVYDRLTSGTERACGDAWRRDLLADLSGDVLEIGAGTGANLDKYGGEVTRLVLSEPDAHMRKKLEAKLGGRRVEVVDWSSERLPAADGSFDAVVSTLVLCSVADQARTLAEIKRVLKPGGRLVFWEHVIADKPNRLKWQRRVEPVWKRMFGNCHLCRDTAGAIERAGFTLESVKRESARKALPVVRPTIRGVAIA